MHGQHNDKYNEMDGQQNDKYTEMDGQQNDKYTEMHGQQNVKNILLLFPLLSWLLWRFTMHKYYSKYRFFKPTSLTLQRGGI